MKSKIAVLVFTLFITAFAQASTDEVRTCWKRPGGHHYRDVPRSICIYAGAVDYERAKLVMEGDPIRGDFDLLPSARRDAFDAVIFRTNNSSGEACGFFSESIIVAQFTPYYSGKVLMHTLRAEHSYSPNPCWFKPRLVFDYYDRVMD